MVESFLIWTAAIAFAVCLFMAIGILFKMAFFDD